MRVEIILKDDNGNVVGQPVTGFAYQPLQWKTPPGKPIIIERGFTPDGISNGAYMLWGFTYTPIITLNMQYKKII